MKIRLWAYKFRVAKHVRAAFPKALSHEVDSVFNIVPLSSERPLFREIGPISINGEILHIPNRIYWQQPAQVEINKLTDIQVLILACLYTRNYDGFVRERYLEQIIRHSEEWVIPYIIQLLGEYVIEIIHRIEKSVDYLNKEQFSKFGEENPEYIRLTRQRIISYWNAYRRHYEYRVWKQRKIQDDPAFQDDPAYKVMHRLGLWSTE